jgi:DNA-binding MarR family transcriptional regulator
MIDGGSRDSMPDGFDWDHLRSTSDAIADPGDQLRRTLARGEAAMPAVEPLPAAVLLAEARRLSAARRFRDRVFGRELFPNPAWNILVELFIAGEEGRNVTIKSACVAAGVPQSTALRHIAHLIEVRLTARAQHPSDARSAYLRLTERGHSKMVTFVSLSAAHPGAPDP